MLCRRILICTRLGIFLLHWINAKFFEFLFSLFYFLKQKYKSAQCMPIDGSILGQCTRNSTKTEPINIACWGKCMITLEVRRYAPVDFRRLGMLCAYLSCVTIVQTNSMTRKFIIWLAGSAKLLRLNFTKVLILPLCLNVYITLRSSSIHETSYSQTFVPLAPVVSLAPVNHHMVHETTNKYPPSML